MGQTKDAIKKEVENIFQGVYANLTEEEKLLTKEEKRELRKYLQEMKDVKIHAYSSIFILRKIKELIASRQYPPVETSKVECSSTMDEPMDPDPFVYEI